MISLIESLREIIGTPDFYIEGTNYNSGTWDYGAMLEYAFCGILVCIVVISVFKLVRKAFD